MLDQQLRGKWRERTVPIWPAMSFAPEGLVLGAGTVLLQMDGPRRLQSLRGQEVRLLALLSAFHGKATSPAALRNIERATKAWSEGDGCLAHIHLAHAGLSRPQDLRLGAYRLEMAQCALKHGASMRAVFKALHLDAQYIEGVEKAYNPEQPRVPAGSGRTSGEWTSDTSDSPGFPGQAIAAPAAASFSDLLPAATDSLGEFAVDLLARFGGPAAVSFGLLFIPSSNNLNVRGEVPGMPGLSYSWNRDDTLLHLNYISGDGVATNFAAQLKGDVFFGQNGKVVARILPGGNIVVDATAVFPDSVNDDEPKLCPMPGLDKPGERGRNYEDYVKSIVNPVDTTPRYWGFQLIDPTSGDLIYYDDCQHETGIMVEAKGPVYAKLLAYGWGRGSITEEWLSQSAAQVAAAGSRTVQWYFAEPAAAVFADELFRIKDAGRERIEIKVLPWTDGP